MHIPFCLFHLLQGLRHRERLWDGTQSPNVDLCGEAFDRDFAKVFQGPDQVFTVHNHLCNEFPIFVKRLAIRLNNLDSIVLVMVMTCSDHDPTCALGLSSHRHYEAHSEADLLHY